MASYTKDFNRRNLCDLLKETYSIEKDIQNDLDHSNFIQIKETYIKILEDITDVENVSNTEKYATEVSSSSDNLISRNVTCPLTELNQNLFDTNLGNSFSPPRRVNSFNAKCFDSEVNSGMDNQAGTKRPFQNYQKSDLKLTTKNNHEHWRNKKSRLDAHGHCGTTTQTLQLDVLEVELDTTKYNNVLTTPIQKPPYIGSKMKFKDFDTFAITLNKDNTIEEKVASTKNKPNGDISLRKEFHNMNYFRDIHLKVRSNSVITTNNYENLYLNRSDMKDITTNVRCDNNASKLDVNNDSEFIGCGESSSCVKYHPNYSSISKLTEYITDPKLSKGLLIGDISNNSDDTNETNSELTSKYVPIYNINNNELFDVIDCIIRKEHVEVPSLYSSIEDLSGVNNNQRCTMMEPLIKSESEITINELAVTLNAPFETDSTTLNDIAVNTTLYNCDYDVGPTYDVLHPTTNFISNDVTYKPIAKLESQDTAVNAPFEADNTVGTIITDSTVIEPLITSESEITIKELAVTLNAPFETDSTTLNDIAVNTTLYNCDYDVGPTYDVLHPTTNFISNHVTYKPIAKLESQDTAVNAPFEADNTVGTIITDSTVIEPLITSESEITIKELAVTLNAPFETDSTTLNDIAVNATLYNCDYDVGPTYDVLHPTTNFISNDVTYKPIAKLESQDTAGAAFIESTFPSREKSPDNCMLKRTTLIKTGAVRNMSENDLQLESTCNMLESCHTSTSVDSQIRNNTFTTTLNPKHNASMVNDKTFSDFFGLSNVDDGGAPVLNENSTEKSKCSMITEIIQNTPEVDCGSLFEQIKSGSLNCTSDQHIFISSNDFSIGKEDFDLNPVDNTSSIMPCLNTGINRKSTSEGTNTDSKVSSTSESYVDLMKTHNCSKLDNEDGPVSSFDNEIANFSLTNNSSNLYDEFVKEHVANKSEQMNSFVDDVICPKLCPNYTSFETVMTSNDERNMLHDTQDSMALIEITTPCDTANSDSNISNINIVNVQNNIECTLSNYSKCSLVNGPENVSLSTREVNSSTSFANFEIHSTDDDYNPVGTVETAKGNLDNQSFNTSDVAAVDNNTTIPYNSKIMNGQNLEKCFTQPTTKENNNIIESGKDNNVTCDRNKSKTPLKSLSSNTINMNKIVKKNPTSAPKYQPTKSKRTNENKTTSIKRPAPQSPNHTNASKKYKFSKDNSKVGYEFSRLKQPGYNFANYKDAQEVADNNDPRWSLYNLNTPQACFETVCDQWGFKSLPNPHYDLTQRFHKKLLFNTSPFVPSQRQFCLDIYGDEINKTVEEINRLKYELDINEPYWNRVHSLQVRRKIQELGDIELKLKKAWDNSYRFLQHFNNDIGWDAKFMSDVKMRESEDSRRIVENNLHFYGQSF